MRTIINILKRRFRFLYVSLFVKPFLRKPEKIKSVAIVFCGGLGDGVLWLQYANNVIEHYEKQGYKVFLICNRSVEELFKNYTNFQNLFIVDNDIYLSIKSIKNALTKVRSIEFDKVINVRVTKTKYQDMYIVKNMFAKEKIGYYEEFAKSNLQEKVFDKLIKIPKDQHEINNHYHFLKQLGINIKQDLYYLRKYVNNQQSNNYIVLCVGASDKTRIWNLDNWVELTQYIINNSDFDIDICGTQNEEFVYEYIQNIIKSDRIINMCGKTSLQDLLDLLGNAKFVVGNDSGPGHIATSVGAKGVILLGGGFNFRFFPHVDIENNQTAMKTIYNKNDCWNCGWRCSESADKFPCVQNIKTRTVIDEIKKLI